MAFRLGRRTAALAVVLGITACGATSSSGKDDDPDAQASRLKVRTVATGLEVPWGIGFLPNGDALVAERTTARIMRIPKGGGTPREAMTVPGVDTEAGEGGLLGLAVSPSYADDGLIYVMFTSGEDNRVVRGKLGGSLEPILTGLDANQIHNGGRIAFGPDGKLYIGAGDAGNPGNAQDAGAREGKILRINPDGSVPSDNPNSGSPVWTSGHRNPQGLAFDSKKRLWSAELGQNDFDEVNLIRKGKNYGWPDVEGRGGTQGGKFTNPLVTWTTDQASPSGAAVKGNYLYVAALRGEAVWRMRISGSKLGKPKRYLNNRYGRIRTVVRAPDGSLWVSTSNKDGRGDPGSRDDRILRVTGI
jgi:glucose/arabinose dehydrogenase